MPKSTCAGALSCPLGIFPNIFLRFTEIVSKTESDDRGRLPTVRALTDVYRRAIKKSEKTYPILGKAEALPEQLPAAVSTIRCGGENLEWCQVGHADADSYILLATEKQLECMREFFAWTARSPPHRHHSHKY